LRLGAGFFGAGLDRGAEPPLRPVNGVRDLHDERSDAGIAAYPPKAHAMAPL